MSDWNILDSLHKISRKSHNRDMVVINLKVFMFFRMPFASFAPSLWGDAAAPCSSLSTKSDYYKTQPQEHPEETSNHLTCVGSLNFFTFSPITLLSSFNLIYHTLGQSIHKSCKYLSKQFELLSNKPLFAAQ